MAHDLGAAADGGFTPGGDGNEATAAVSAQESAAGQESPAATVRALEATVAELEDRWRRALADLENLRKRHARELGHEAQAERRRICLAWLPVVDNLELALDHAAGDPAAVIVGVRAVRDQAVALLAALGFPRDDETGVPFDPLRHEAVGVVDEPGTAPGTVVRVLRPGYGVPPDRQLRPAAVMVSRKQE
jgi:molecular chaperone GrpE